MKTQSLMGIILIAVGVIGLSYQGIKYTTRDNAVDLGPIQVTTKTTRTIPFSPVIGGLVLVGGIALLVMAGRSAERS
ncbi:DUF3185 domain-containing protein [Candidatus Sumerlaeota bacterium]|nr:DUF3185 domain-containing protein [Candidatus Sumerlaeota bacterium]